MKQLLFIITNYEWLFFRENKEFFFNIRTLYGLNVIKRTKFPNYQWISQFDVVKSKFYIDYYILKTYKYLPSSFAPPRLHPPTYPTFFPPFLLHNPTRHLGSHIRKLTANLAPNFYRNLKNNRILSLTWMHCVHLNKKLKEKRRKIWPPSWIILTFAAFKVTRYTKMRVRRLRVILERGTFFYDVVGAG